MKALEALGRKAEAAGIAKEMREYATARSRFPAEALALLTVGWIDLERASLVYGPIRFRHAAGTPRAADGGRAGARWKCARRWCPSRGSKR